MQNLIVKDKDGNLTVTSLVVAELFDRPHHDVMKSIRKVMASAKVEVSFSFKINELANGKRDKYYNLTERQFLIAMPFIGGNKSLEGQIRLVDEFIRLRSEQNYKNRHIDAIRSLLLLDAPATWEKLYPEEFFIACMNLYGHKFNGNNSTPMYVVQIIRRWIYDIVLPPELNFEIDTKRGIEKKNQWFCKDDGRSALLAQISKVEMIARLSTSRADFESKCATEFLGEPLQLNIMQ